MGAFSGDSWTIFRSSIILAGGDVDDDDDDDVSVEGLLLWLVGWSTAVGLLSSAMIAVILS